MNSQDVRNRIDALLPSIRHRRQEIEQLRRMPEDLIQSLVETGIFTMAVPRKLGGLEATPAEVLLASEAVASADGSAGWCAMIGLSGNMVSGYMQEAGARDIFSDPRLPTAGIAGASGSAVRVKDGVTVNGRWAFASGIDHCRTVWAGCVVHENGQPKMTEHGPEIIHVCLPAGSVTIHDTWRVSGLCGTGSSDFSAAGIFVPDRNVFALLDSSTHRKEPLYRVPPLAMFVFQAASVSLGIARAALDEFQTIAQTKVPTLYREVLADKPPIQVEYARCEAALGAARAFLYRTLDEMWQTVIGGEAPSLRQVAAGRAACTHAVETSAAVARTLNTIGGASNIYSSASLQRHARDSEVVPHHFTVAPYTWEEIGRVMLGRQPSVPIF